MVGSVDRALWVVEAEAKECGLAKVVECNVE